MQAHGDALLASRLGSAAIVMLWMKLAGQDVR
jgi:predicted small integral membrane protein